MTTVGGEITFSWLLTLPHFPFPVSTCFLHFSTCSSSQECKVPKWMQFLLQNSLVEAAHCRDQFCCEAFVYPGKNGTFHLNKDLLLQKLPTFFLFTPSSQFLWGGDYYYCHRCHDRVSDGLWKSQTERLPKLGQNPSSDSTSHRLQLSSHMANTLVLYERVTKRFTDLLIFLTSLMFSEQLLNDGY